MPLPIVYAEIPREGSVLPCSKADIHAVIERLPASDLEGLHKIGLVNPHSKKDGANARYFLEPEPHILIFAYPESLAFPIGRNQKKVDLLRFYEREIEFGLELVCIDGFWSGQWTPDGLRRFILWHVLLHEIGHHVYRMGLSGRGDQSRLREDSEKSAEHYARRMSRLLGL